MHFLYSLAKRYPQLLLPVKKDERLTEEYKDLCLRGKKSKRKPKFSFDPKDQLDIVETEYGKVECITFYQREDFIHAVRALAYRLEPEAIPDSTGAIAIFGLNNVEKFFNNEENYKDNIILLSSGYYSNCDTATINACTNNEYCLSDEKWIDKSITIRKYHELTHFYMRQKNAKDIMPIRDELIADAVGLLMAFGCLDERMLNCFLGIENNTLNPKGRLVNYEGGKQENLLLIKEIIVIIKQVYKNDDNNDIATIWHKIDIIINELNNKKITI